MTESESRAQRYVIIGDTCVVGLQRYKNSRYRPVKCFNDRESAVKYRDWMNSLVGRSLARLRAILTGSGSRLTHKINSQITC